MIVIAHVILISGVLLQFFFHEKVFDYSTQNISKFMFNIRNIVFSILAILFSSLANPYIVAFALLVSLLICRHKLKLLNFLFFVSFSTFLISSLKSLYRDPRPYMVNAEITPVEGFAEYGNPSGHTSMGFILISYVFEEFIYNRKLYIH